MSHTGPGTSVIVGMGQIGTLVARGLAVTGSAILEVRRGELARLEGVTAAERILLAVPEDALAAVVASVPAALRAGIVLVQNELLPGTWRDLGLGSPTVAVVWFEKKAGREAVALLPTVVGGPGRAAIASAIRAVGLPAVEVTDDRSLIRALVAKNLYIRVANLGGLASDLRGTAPGGAAWPTGVTAMGELLGEHAAFARTLGREVFALDVASLGEEDARDVSFEEAWEGVESATRADPVHACKGRAAPSRLARAAERAERTGVDAPVVLALRGATAG